MPSFNNQADIERYFRKSGGSGAGFFNEKQLRAIMEQEVERLKICIQKHIDDYYGSYYPKVYDRRSVGSNFQTSLETRVTTKGKFISAEVYFNDNAYAPSRFGGDDGYLPILYEFGWKWKQDGARPQIYRLSYYEGYQMVQKGIDDFMKNNPYGLRIVMDAKYENQVIDYRVFM